MPRAKRASAGGVIYHVSNRAEGRKKLFRDSKDYVAFIGGMTVASEAVGMRIVGYCLLPDHWELLLWPRKDGDLSRFILRVATSHLRHNRDHHRIPPGDNLYAGRFKNFPIQPDEHLVEVLKFVETSAVRAKLVRNPSQWEWSSLKQHADSPTMPVRIPTDWQRIVGKPIDPSTLTAIELCHKRGRPYGTPAWVNRIVDRLDLAHTLRPQGRPRKTVKKK